MERIGIAASKMAQGNLVLYNLFVVLISILFSLFLFVIAGSSMVLALLILAYVVNGVMPLEFEKNWSGIFRLCMITLTIVVSLFNLAAILKNIRLKRSIK